MRLPLFMTAALVVASCSPASTVSEQELRDSADAAAARGTPWAASGSASASAVAPTPGPASDLPEGLTESADAAAARGAPWNDAPAR